MLRASEEPVGRGESHVSLGWCLQRGGGVVVGQFSSPPILSDDLAPKL